ncbi:tRNA (N(6)-L-threonylcarbamoyladenosine(37)-C(2))-methylthiotransferase MtaB [bacterium]|nr:tRNA (N(6)-L-threonylcarbamoyladenosine(37)-C(2))-methylthiotransferase MtaB [bacterium]
MARSKIRKLSVATTGCRLNQYESERMAAELYRYGFVRAEKGEKADLYLINTCTVTHRADSTSRNLISRAARENPDGRIVVAGCYVDSDPEAVAGMEGVDVLIGNTEKDDITRILPRKLPELFDDSDEPDKGCSGTIADFYHHNRAWIKISDGCNQWCSFCILPTVRGRLNNRPALEIIGEINGLVAKGFEEVVLTGIHIGHYKNRKVEPQVKNLANLLKMIMRETDLKRVRVSSIEPQTVRDELLEVYADSNGRICRHWHLPLQSGSSNILKAMRRPYNQAMYLNRLADVKKIVPETIIGADVIVGFPGETDEDFEKTKGVCESGLIDYLHVFSYSDRTGTTATEMPDKVNPEVIKHRNAILTRVSKRIRCEAMERQVGSTLGVVSEFTKRKNRFHFGVSDNYMKVRLPDNFESGKRIVDVRITECREDQLIGEIADDSLTSVA